MYQNLDGTQQKPKTLLVIIIVIAFIAAITGTAFIVFKNQTNDIKENKDYKEENNSTTSNNDKEDTEAEEENQEQEDEPIQQITYSNIEQLTYSKIKEMIKEKRSFVVVISQTYCSHCIAYKPIYNDVLKEHNSKGYDLDIVDLEKEEREELLNEFNVEGTPTTLIFIDGVLQNDRKIGVVEKSDLENFLGMYGFI